MSLDQGLNLITRVSNASSWLLPRVFAGPRPVSELGVVVVGLAIVTGIVGVVPALSEALLP